MKILICNERFLFRFGVDRVLLLLGHFWRKAGHEVVMMGNKLDPPAVEKCADRFIRVPEAPDWLHGNDFTAKYLADNWDEWFVDGDAPDVALVAGWPFYKCIGFLREKCGTAVFHDYGAVPMDGMTGGQRITQMELRKMRAENLKLANKVVAISKFLEDSQSKIDAGRDGMDVPTSYVHLGVDHLALNLWRSKEVGAKGGGDVIAEVEKLKKDGYKIIFQPGRWEVGNYKNSIAGVEVSRKLHFHGVRHKILVLSQLDGMIGLPGDMKDSYFCLGHIDDETMRRVMELSDAGISPTLWEGFDLPLGEMQYLDKPMFVLDVGAHPEVVANPYFLCKDIAEMGDKLVSLLKGGLPFPAAAFQADCAKFRAKFTWERSAGKLLDALKTAVMESMVVFVDVTNACHDTANSGVMRVTRKVSHYLQEKATTVFVLWDDSVGKYVFPYDDEVKMLCSYGGPDESKITYKSANGRPRRLLDEVMPKLGGRRKAHLFTETVNHESMRKAEVYFHAHGVCVAAVFYDAIAVYRPELCAKDVSENHGLYMRELADCDLVMPIAPHNQRDLERYWNECGIEPTTVATVGLAAEMDGVPRETAKVPADKISNGGIRILFVSTLEPRKNHIRFLKGLEILFERHPELTDKVTVHLVGNRYAGNTEIPAFVQDFCKRHGNVKWLGVVDDDTLKKEYRECTFTAYPSEIEGFGMPIIESLWFGKPCLCSDGGSIGELAGKGGCCPTDVLSEEGIAQSLHRMITDGRYLAELQHQAVDRDITTWNEYVDGICGHLFDLRPVSGRRMISKAAAREIEKHFEGWTGRRVIIASNYYPPRFVGGAEIIAHNQVKALMAAGLAKVVVFAVDTSPNRVTGNVYAESFEGVLVVRLSVADDNFDSNGINFFDPKVNTVFDELCGIVKPSVVHCHNIVCASLGIVDVARNHQAKVCVTLHDNWGFCFKNTMLDNCGMPCRNVFGCASCKEALTAGGIYIPIGVRKSYFRRAFEKIDAYISPSAYLADSYMRAGFDFHKMNVLWNGIDADRFEAVGKIPSDKIRIPVVAYFGRHKGIDTLIRAVAKLGRDDIEINLVGSGSEQDNYKSLAAECGVLHSLRFWGRVANHDIGKAYAETDIYCLPSRWPENQPVSITEAMACGLPVVASDLGGSKELVRDGETGYVFRADDVDDLAAKLKTLVDDESLRLRFGDAGREAMLRNSFDAQVRKLVGIYDGIVGGKASSKKIVAFKGSRLPRGVDVITPCDVTLFEWLNKPGELRDVIALFLLPGQRLEGDEAKSLSEYGIPVFVCASEFELVNMKMAEMGINVFQYMDDADILAKIAEISCARSQHWE